jgi:superfamily II DNA or RNA helicase
VTLGEFTLRPHQIRAVQEARETVARLLAQGLPPRVLILAPCGAGKTVISSALIQGALNKGKTAAFFASGRLLIDQKSKTLNRAGIPHAVLMAKREDQWWHSSVLVASKDTYTSRAIHSDKISRESRDLWIPDECHRTLTDEWMEILPQDNKTPVIGLSATPALGNGRGLGAYYKAIVQAATYAELLEAKLLVPCRVFAPWSVDTRGLKKTGDGDWSWAQAETRFNKKVLIGNVVETWKKLGDGRPTACFAQGVEHSIGLCDEFNRAGVPAAHIDADTDPEDREKVFAGLRDGSIQVACNFGVLTTGWDEPCVSCGILAFATDSLVKYMQVAGRMLRTFPGKSEALIIDHGDNVRRHGWPTEDHEWDLNPEESVRDRDFKAREQQKKPREPICCPKCGAMRETGPKCMNCGHQHVRSGVRVLNEDGRLEEIKPRQAAKAVNQNVLQKTWMQCLAVAASRSGNFYTAKAIFSKKTGKRADDMRPMPEQHKLNMAVGVVYPGFVKRRKAITQ